MHLEKIREDAAKLNLCNHCLGRLYGMLGHGLTNEERGRAIRIILAMEKNEEYRLDDAEFAIVAFGTTARAAKTAVDIARDKGIKVGLLRVVTIWPSPEETLNRLAKQVKAILVPELNMGQYVLEVERCARGEAPVYRLNRANGKVIFPSEIVEKLEEISKAKV